MNYEIESSYPTIAKSDHERTYLIKNAADPSKLLLISKKNTQKIISPFYSKHTIFSRIRHCHRGKSNGN